MKLNMSILYDELRAYARSASLRGGQELTLFGCRSFPQDTLQLSSRYVYICTPTELLRIEERQKKDALNFISIGEMNFQSVNWQIIYLKGNIHAEDVLDLVQEVFEDCTEWDTELAAAATVPNNYQVMLDIGARKLWNPIALTDLAMYDLARSGQFVGNAVTWGSLSSGYAELEKSSDQDIATTSHLLRINRTPFYVPNIRNDAQYVMAPIYSHDTICGILKTNDMNQPITAGQLSYVHRIQTWIERATSLTPIPIPLENENLAFADKLLEGVPVNPADVTQALAHHGWCRKEEYILCVSRLISGAEIGTHRAKNYLLRIKSSFPDCIAFIQEPYIILVIRDEPALRSTRIHELKCILDKARLCAGVSLPFVDFMCIKDAFNQAVFALENGVKANSTSQIYDLKDQYTEFVLHIIEKSQGLNCICHAKLLDFAQQGGEKEIIYVRSLREYLTHGCNTSATANAMFIHRNTLRNYLEHLQQGTGIDISSIDEDNLLFLYLSCLCAEYLDAKKEKTDGPHIHRRVN